MLVSADIYVECDESVKQGNILPVYIVSDSNLENITLSFNRNNKTYGKFRGYRISKNSLGISDNAECYLLMLSVASDAYPDIYTLDIRWQRKGYAERKLLNLTVEKGNFKKRKYLFQKDSLHCVKMKAKDVKRNQSNNKTL